MAEVAVHALELSIVGVILSIPIGIGVAKLLERDPADWRAFFRMRLPRRVSYPVTAVSSMPTASSATIVATSPWLPPLPGGPPHPQDLQRDTRTHASVLVAM
jgi:hypothetical protein